MSIDLTELKRLAKAATPGEQEMRTTRKTRDDLRAEFHDRKDILDAMGDLVDLHYALRVARGALISTNENIKVKGAISIANDALGGTADQQVDQ
ncbi:MAG: hypothetical protein AABY11_00665 [archaeon]